MAPWQCCDWHNWCNTMENLSLPFQWKCVNEIVCYSQCSCVQTRNLPSNSVILFPVASAKLCTTTFKYVMSVWFLICITACSYATTIYTTTRKLSMITEKRYMKKSMHYMNLLWLCYILMASEVCGVLPWCNTFVALENTGKW